ncbi:MAG: bifunctional DNA-formamidopyrimidine glycosylase/DNA-(apurinic or apyrimidinic site) lyase [Granulosicoccus sp.]
MPELPEVETTCRGIAPHLVGQAITALKIHDRRLRWPVPDDVHALQNKQVLAVERRGKYILIKVQAGTAIVHLGMSGSLRICTTDEPRRKHDHVEMVLSSGAVIRFHDPRRFGCLLWQAAGTQSHQLLANLGPEPLSAEFDPDYLFRSSRKRQVAIKNLIMNSQVVVGVGNIYASEALFLAGIRPGRAARRISRENSQLLVDAIKQVLQRSIDQGGTTLRDFINSDGNPGYFAQLLNVYGRTGEPCRVCGNPIKQKTLGQRSSFYCSECQR